MDKRIQLAPCDRQNLKIIWDIGFREARPEWKNWDGPYFDDDYSSYQTFAAFLDDNAEFYENEGRRCILYDGKPVGIVNRFWKDAKTRWLEVGITLFEAPTWGHGIGTEALKLWISETFNDFPELEHVGLVTWSGNHRMMRVAEKLGMVQEARIRKVRFYNGVYYDSVSYGVLREEWVED